MRRPRLTRSRRTLALATLALGALAAAISIPLVAIQRAPSPASAKRADVAALARQSLRTRFILLSRRHTNKCGLLPESLSSIAVHGRLQGSCCFPMNHERYVAQVHGLRKYASVAQIPADPYDVPVSLARELISYQKHIGLTPAQQATYDRATKLSDEHGPCCCRCWRWTAFEGQAKFLITRRGYRAAQIADVWNLEDGCGGPSASSA